MSSTGFEFKVLIQHDTNIKGYVAFLPSLKSVVFD